MYYQSEKVVRLSMNRLQIRRLAHISAPFLPIDTAITLKRAVMSHKFLIGLILLIFSWPTTGEANPSALVSLDVTLAGYRLGMSHQEVTEVRPFNYEQSFKNNIENTSTFYASADRVYIDGVVMKLQVSFENENVYKIVARVSPDSFGNVLQSIQQTMGGRGGQIKDLQKL